MKNRPSATWLDLANRAVNAFEELVESATFKSVTTQWTSAGKDGDGSLSILVNDRVALTLDRKEIERQLAWMDRASREQAEREKAHHEEIDEWLEDCEKEPP